jgi:cytochrome oxidase Cu insertion factor (SCO1/SenC/PrrC family)
MKKMEWYKLLAGGSLWAVLVAFIFYVPFMPLTLEKKVDVPFLDNKGNKAALVFFGFHSCSDVCPLMLSQISRLLRTEVDMDDWPQVIFVDIDMGSNSALASAYAKQFHPSFIGHHVTTEELSQLTIMFGLNVKQESDRITHLGKTYLLHYVNDNWTLIKAYNPESFSVEGLHKALLKLAI